MKSSLTRCWGLVLVAVIVGVGMARLATAGAVTLSNKASDQNGRYWAIVDDYASDQLMGLKNG